MVLSAVLILNAPVLILNSYSENASISEMQQAEQETQSAISSLEKQTKETQSAISSLEAERKNAESNVNSLSQQSAALTNEYNSYSDKLSDISDEIAEAEAKLADTSHEIVELNAALSENTQKKDELYDMLKKQIKSSYESGINTSLVFSLLSCRSLREFLNRTEYITAIVSYQQKLLTRYKEIEEQMLLQMKDLEDKQAELDSYQATLDEKQGELESLAGDVQSALSLTNRDISNEKSKLANYNAELAALDKKMKSLESQVAEAQAKLARQIAERLAAQEAAGRKEDTSGSYAATDEELVWLAATIQAEADGESYNGKLGVGTVIMNRVKSSSFPNSVKGVITQNMQFASYRSGKVELIIQKGPNSTCLQAARETLNGARIGDYLFFMTKYYADYYRISEYTMIGNHAFFYKWVTKEKEEPTPEEPEEKPLPEGSNEENNEEQIEVIPEEVPEEVFEENYEENNEDIPDYDSEMSSDE